MQNSPIALALNNAILSRIDKEAKAQAKLAAYDRRGVVTGIRGGRAEVRTALGNRVYVPARNVITNGRVVNNRVLVSRPALGRPFIDAEVRG